MGIAWLLIMHLMLQPGVNFAGIQWDHPPDEKGASFPVPRHKLHGEDTGG